MKKSRPEPYLKAEKRAIKNRPRMKVSGASLKRPSNFAGLKAIKNLKPKA